MSRSVLFSALLLLAVPSFAAANWQQPTPEELQMTAQPEVPGAAAVYLNMEETTDDREDTSSDFDVSPGENRQNFHTLYVRMKILSEAGRGYADVEILYPGRDFSVGDVQGRTIHSDGSIVPFTGKPFQKQNTTVFAMPDVQVGSIIEYRYSLKYDSRHVVPPQWYIQQGLFVRSAKYYFRANSRTIRDAHGNLSDGTAYSANLPKGAAVKYISSQNAYELNVHNIAPIPSEEFMPPLESLSYRVLFYYTGNQKEEDYWQTEGRYWSKDVDKFVSSPKLKDEVSHLLSPTDNDQQKVTKIYQAVMQLENTSFTRERTQAESRGIRNKTAEDIWSQKRGNADQITLLFIAMVRAAGLNAYAMRVTNRDRAIFVSSFLDMSQLDDYIAIVQMDGKEQFFDPGERYCAFGQLHWKHTVSQGLRQTGAGTAIAKTPSAAYTQAQTSRMANLEIDADGKVHGFIRITMAGVPALYWRQRALQNDEAEIKHEIEQELQSSLPPGIQVKTHHFVALEDWSSALMVQLDVSGSMGTATSRRIILPSSFFEAGNHPRFVSDRRETPVYLQYANELQDSVTIDLPKTLTVNSVPKDANFPLPSNALCKSQYAVKDGTYTFKRTFILANFYYDPSDYKPLKSFYQQVATQDQEPLILTAAAAGGGQ